MHPLIGLLGTSAAAAAFSPDDIDGLRVWLRGDDLTGANADPVASWADQSGNAYDAAQATGTKQPTKRTSVLNGHTVCRFDGGDCLQTGEIAYGSATALTVYCVGSCVSGTDRAFFESGAATGSNNGTYILYRPTSNKVSFYVRHTVDAERQSVATVAATNDFGLMCGIWNQGMLNHHEVSTYVDGDAAGALNPTGNTGSPLTDAILNIGARNNAASLFLNGDIAEIIIYTGAHTAIQRKRVEDYLAAKYALTVRSITANIVFEGDSLTEADRGTSPFVNSYPQQLAALLTDGIHFWNTGVSGQTLAQMDTDKATQIAPFYASGIAKNIVVLWGGTNDMAQGVGNQTAATALSRLYALGDYYLSAGWQVVLLDCLPRSDAAAGAGFAAKRTTFNADFATNAAAHCTVPVRVSQISGIGADGDSDVTTNYDGDKVHLNATGHGLIAAAVETALGTLGVT